MANKCLNLSNKQIRLLVENFGEVKASELISAWEQKGIEGYPSVNDLLNVVQEQSDIEQQKEKIERIKAKREAEKNRLLKLQKNEQPDLFGMQKVDIFGQSSDLTQDNIRRILSKFDGEIRNEEKKLEQLIKQAKVKSDEEKRQIELFPTKGETSAKDPEGNAQTIQFETASSSGNYTGNDLQLKKDNDPSAGDGVVETLSAQWEENRNVVFSGKTKIKSAADVAHIMRFLEDKAVEHFFAVHIDKKGEAHIQFVSMGGISATVADPFLVAQGARRFGAVKTYLIHNHPSGNMNPSRADIELTDRIRAGLKLIGVKKLEHIIMDTYKQEYVHLTERDTLVFTREDQKEEEERQYTSSMMNGFKRLMEPLDLRIMSSREAVTAIFALRFSAFPKRGMLVLDRANNVVANYFIQDFDPATALSKVLNTPTATSVIFYGNEPVTGVRLAVLEAKAALQWVNISVIDHVAVVGGATDVNVAYGLYRSARDEGFLDDGVEYKTKDQIEREQGTNRVSEPEPEAPVLRPLPEEYRLKPEEKTESVADKIRKAKIRFNGQAMAVVLPVPQVWNMAVELVAKAIEGGVAVRDALRQGYDYIASEYKAKKYKDKWTKSQYNQLMIDALKKKGVFTYNLTQRQRDLADKIIDRIVSGNSNLAKEYERIERVHDKAYNFLVSIGASQQQIQDLLDSQIEFKKYLLQTMAASEFEKATTIDLRMGDQTFGQKVKQKVLNRLQRLEQLKRTMIANGITITDAIDFLNFADRWRSLAEARINKIFASIGFSDTDIFVWKAFDKIQGSLFDRMNEDGVDYREFNIWLYALHAPERNDHIAMMRSEALNKHIAMLKQDLADLQAIFAATASPKVAKKIERMEAELLKYEEYIRYYADPLADRDLVAVLEQSIDKKMRLMDDGGSGMTNQQAQEVLDELQKEVDDARLLLQTLPPEQHTPELIRQANKLDVYEKYRIEVKEKIFEPALTLRHEYQLIDDAQLNRLRTYYKNYVPMVVDEEYFIDNGWASHGYSGAKILRASGADWITFENRVAPVTQGLLSLQDVIFQGEQNRYHRSIADAARVAPDPNIWEIASVRNIPVRDRMGNVIAVREVAAPDQGISIPVYESGVKRYILIKDEALRRSIKEEDVKQAIPLLAKINTFIRAFATVYSPEFIATNLIRDMQMAGMILSGEEQKQIKKAFSKNRRKMLSIIKGSYRAIKDKGDINTNKTEYEKWAKKYEELGGLMSWYHPESAPDRKMNVENAYNAYKRAPEKNAMVTTEFLISAFEWADNVNSAIENGTRVAVFKSAVDAGLSEAKAVELARNATVNFNKKGDWGALMSSLWLFANASIQGSANVLRSTLTTRGGARVAGSLMLAGFLQSVVNNFFSECDDPEHPGNCYDNVGEGDKSRNMMIRSPFSNGFLKMPMPYGYSLFYFFGENVGQWVHGKMTAAKMGFSLFGSILDQFNPLAGMANTEFLAKLADGKDISKEGVDYLIQSISPTATDPLWQFYSNKDQFGRRIYSDYKYDKRPDAYKATPYDSKTSKAITQWMNNNTGGSEKVSGGLDVSPGTVDWLANTLFGSFGNFVGKVGTAGDLAGTGFKAAYDNIVKGSESPEAIEMNKKLESKMVDITPSKLPMVGRFYTLPKERADRTMIYDYYDASFNKLQSKESYNEWFKELEKAVRLKQIDPLKARGYNRKVKRNQFELRNPDFVKILDESKDKLLPKERIDSFIKQVRRLEAEKKLPEETARGYQATISRHQNEYKKKHGIPVKK